MTQFHKAASFDGITLKSLRTDSEETFSLTDMETAKGFQLLFQIDYEQSGELAGKQGYDKYIAFYLDRDWEAEQKRGTFVSGLLDFIPVKPMIECITGEDMITGRELSDMERSMQGISAGLGIIGIGKATVLLKEGGKDGAKIFAKTMAVNAAEDTAVYLTGAIGQELGLPDPLVMALIPSGGQHRKALSSADHDFKGAYQRYEGGHSDCESKSSNGQKVRFG